MATHKIAVIGSGASAFGVLAGLESLDLDAEVTVFSSSKYFGFSPGDRYAVTDSESFYAEVYADIKNQAMYYPPRKTFYGDTVPCYRVKTVERFFKSDMFGGQTNIWGGFVLPLRVKDFASWPIMRKDLEPHYQAIADLIGIAGRHNRVSAYLQFEFNNRPPVKQLKGFEFLEHHINNHSETADFNFHAGASLNTVDTRNDSPTGCIHCGECMAGCLRDAIYSTRKILKERIDTGAIRFVAKNIKEIRLHGNKPAVYPEDGDRELFDKVFLCAGCVSTTEIIMRSLNIKKGPVMQDNNIYQFPILNLSRYSDERKNEYFGLTNLLLLLEPNRIDLPFLQVQLYPNVDYIWRTLVPKWSWDIVRFPVRWLRDRVLWARVYMAAGESNRYRVRLQNDRLEFKEEKKSNGRSLARFIENVRQVLRGSGYYLPPFKPILAHTSAHLASTFPYGGGLVRVARDGEIMSQVHLADSTCFPESPVISPTLTIMANARRTAIEALRK